MNRILGIVMMLFCLQFFALTVNAEVQEKKPQDVKLEKGDSNNDDTHPRSLIDIPMTCFYLDGAIQLTMLEEVGEWEVIVTNQTTGEQWSAVNGLSLSTSTASGIYLVQIITEDGSLYYGTYSIQ